MLAEFVEILLITLEMMETFMQKQKINLIGR